tara:strand:- start:1675 stop:2775 length:1101 start_codon:yes stop_codon:yes gene_type:complete
MKNIVFISPNKYHFNGVVSDAQSDVYFHFKNSLKEINNKITIAKFIKSKKGYLQLDLKLLKKKVDKNSVVFIDGNISIEDNTIYPLELFYLLKNSKGKIVCFVPDLIKQLKFEKWVKLSDIIIGFSKNAVDWANKFYKTKKFKFYPSLPLKLYNKQNLNDFFKRPYDIGYIGSDKKFRSKFLNELKNKAKIDVKLLIVNTDNRLKNYKTTESYLKEISKCKFYFCTRASVYENYSENIFNIDYREGRFANRVSEAIICGCIPMYWQPKFDNSFFTPIKKRFLFSRKKIIPSRWGTIGNLASLPYDNMNKNLKNGIEIVNNVEDALLKVKNLRISYISNKLKYGRKIYKTYISPISFYNFVKSKLND